MLFQVAFIVEADAKLGDRLTMDLTLEATVVIDRPEELAARTQVDQLRVDRLDVVRAEAA